MLDADFCASSSFTVPFRSTNSSTESVSGRTEDNIDTTFSPGGWSGTFKGATDYFPNSTRKASPRRANSKSGFAPASAGSRKGSVPTSAHGPDGVTPTSSTLETPGGTKFSMEQWQKAFQDGSWVIPPPPSRPPKNLATDRGPGYDPNQAPSHTQGTKEDPHVVTDSSSDHTGDDVNRRARAAHPSADADAMDIDTPPPASTRPAESTSASDSAPEPRLYSVPPSVWRQQQSAHSRESQKTSPQPPSQKVTTDADLSASLHDLSNVEPIGNPGTTGDRGPGLQNLNELGTNLPFQSQASSVPPISITKQQQQQPSPFEPQRLHTPAVPSAPEPPTRLSQTSWHAHAAAFAKYLEAFHAFSKTLLTHFDAREQQAQARMHTGTIWLEAVGDGGTARSVGFGHYLQGVREDEAVRETWRVGCERHAEAVKEFDRLRGRVAQLISAGTFADS
ncbi:uncharacterized protein K489DRAFT_163653 [Dissoconium aciculare CBS 342.82]|uniref:Uncharacterized protein n=1 Tax=Dissoconium aciculare CBS 342.82 TaxID=1314786 RepID=A0A6J3MDG2_9PEZI|nr:uncharacterized protein K489DRAFT_163653 [Dissoconium aciculare CBS 342.82]KAF1825639.1 hypothetical protein K489DRAFT_163653 [Dissoconium aciculare CBS 342.82]